MYIKNYFKIHFLLFIISNCLVCVTASYICVLRGSYNLQKKGYRGRRTLSPKLDDL